MKKRTLGLLALLFGVAALGLAVIPAIALDSPLPWIPPPQDPAAAAEAEAGLKFQFKDFSIRLGAGQQDPAAIQAAQDAVAAEHQRLADRSRLLKWFTISAVSCGLIGLVLGPLSWVRENQPVLAGIAMTICFIAIVWQYVALGIFVGVAVAVFLIVISNVS